MGQDTPKQYLELANATIIEHAVYKLLLCPFVERIVIGISADDQFWPTLALATHDCVFTAPGGETRAETVENCLAQLNDEDPQRWVLVHDAVRPCVSREDIALMWQSLQDDECGGLLALPISDTVKHADRDERVEQTLDRSQLWTAQTPQMFRLGALIDALVSARNKGIEVTDEASAIEQAGGKPKLFYGSESNIKITRPADLSLAAFYLSDHQED